jgi:hypothetical protein
MLRQSDRHQGRYIYAVLVSRLFLFLLFQIIIALLAGSWPKSENYWLLSATLTNFVSIALLFFLFRREGINYLDIFRINRAAFRKDILIFAGITIISVPLVFAPGYLLSLFIWGDPNTPTEMMFNPIENWLVYILLIAFPVTISLSELATYFVYIMPRLKRRMKSNWMAVLLPVLFLSIQHCTLPLIPDINFIFYRALVFLPFALLIGISIYFRPSLFPYFAILHGLMDFGTALMFLIEPV